MAILKEAANLSMSDLRKLRSMRPGMSVDIQVAAPTGVKRLRTEYVGMDGTRAMIFRFPDEQKWGGMRDAIYQDNHLVVRYILEDQTGEVVAFKVKISLILTKPSHLIFTSFPLSIQAQGLRAEQRAASSIAATLFAKDGTTPIAASTIVDISTSGCCFSVPKSGLKTKITPKSEVKLQLNKPGGDTTQIAGTVMNARADEVAFYFGTKFEASEDVIEGVLSDLLIDVN